jgi:hypothetical protein
LNDLTAKPKSNKTESHQDFEVCVGLPYFSSHNIPKLGENAPSDQKIYVPDIHKLRQTALQYQNMPKFSIPSPSNMYQKWDFWSANKPSGNPGFETPPVIKIATSYIGTTYVPM